MSLNRNSPLTEALEVVQQRRKNYGSPLTNMESTALIWSGILGTEVTPQQVAMCMVGLKLSRESYKPGRDNRTDMAGYVELLDICETAING